MLVKKLSKTTILLHWLVALSFIVTMSIPFLPEAFSSTPTHKSLGLIVFVFALLRVIWRIKEGWLSPTAPQSKAMLLFAKLAHFALLVATLIMPISGAAMSVGGGRGLDIFGFVIVASSPEKIEWLAEFGKTIHFSALYVLLTLIGVHLLAAIKHQFINKDKTLSRMLGKV